MIRPCTLFVVLLFFMSHLTVFTSENKNIEPGKSYLKIVEKLKSSQIILHTDPYLASNMLNECIELSQKNNEDSLFFVSRKLYAISFSYRDQLDSALLLSQSLIKDIPKDKYFETRSSVYNLLGSLYGKNNDLDKSLEFLLLADSLAGISNAIELKISIRNNIANIYMQNNDIQKALDSYKSALTFAKSNKINTGFVWSLTNNIILSYADSKQIDSARVYFYELLPIESQQNVNKSESILNYAFNFMRREEIDSALYFISMAYDSLNPSQKSTKIRIDISKARILLQTTREERFVDTLLAKINDPDFAEILQVPLSVYDKIYNYYENLGDYKKAFFYYKKYVSLNDSIMAKSNSAKIKAIEFNLKYQKLQNQFDLQKEHINEQDTREILLFVVVGSLAVFIIIFIWIGFYRKKVIYVLAEQKKEISEQYTLVEEKNKQLESQNQEIESMLEDLTKSKSYLEKLNKQKNTFLSVLTHQLTNQVQAVMMSSEALYISRDEPDPKFIRKFSEIIYSSSNHLGYMLANLKEWSNTQSSNIQIHKEQIDVRNILDMIIFNMKQDLDKKDIQINIGFKSLDVCSDRSTLTSILKNLISNSVKYSHDSGKIQIEGIKAESHTEIRVQDFGIGISLANQSKLFNIETRFSTKGTKGEIGTGLGLLICKELVELNNGTIEIISKEKEGTTAVIKFPLEDA